MTAALMSDQKTALVYNHFIGTVRVRSFPLPSPFGELRIYAGSWCAFQTSVTVCGDFPYSGRSWNITAEFCEDTDSGWLLSRSLVSRSGHVLDIEISPEPSRAQRSGILRKVSATFPEFIANWMEDNSALLKDDDRRLNELTQLAWHRDNFDYRLKELRKLLDETVARIGKPVKVERELKQFRAGLNLAQTSLEAMDRIIAANTIKPSSRLRLSHRISNEVAA